LPSLDDRINARIVKSPGCWEWDGAHALNGYAVVNVGSHRTELVHRIMYAREYGEAPKSLVIDHKCHNRGCINPAHLHAVTTKQNNENRSGPQSSSTSGIRGVSFYPPRKKWRARLQHNGRERHVGYFASREDAEVAVTRARRQIFSNSVMDFNPDDPDDNPAIERGED